jgi:hypothetical protein
MFAVPQFSSIVPAFSRYSSYSRLSRAVTARAEMMRITSSCRIRCTTNNSCSSTDSPIATSVASSGFRHRESSRGDRRTLRRPFRRKPRASSGWLAPYPDPIRTAARHGNNEPPRIQRIYVVYARQEVHCLRRRECYRRRGELNWTWLPANVAPGCRAFGCHPVPCNLTPVTCFVPGYPRNFHVRALRPHRDLAIIG